MVYATGQRAESGEPIFIVKTDAMRKDVMLVQVAGPVRTCSGRFPVYASVFRTEDGRLLQGLGRTSAPHDEKAMEHAAWRSDQGHESDAGKDWFAEQWPGVLQ